MENKLTILLQDFMIRFSFLQTWQQITIGVMFLAICFIIGYWIGQAYKHFRASKGLPKEPTDEIRDEAMNHRGTHN